MNRHLKIGIKQTQRILCLILAIITVFVSAVPTVVFAGSTAGSITVRFSLYGDKKHDSTVCHVYPACKDSYQAWINEKSVKVPSGSVALDVFEKALTSAGITWTNLGGGYISEINGLSELDNGSLSGWMYYLNGVSPMLGADEQPVENNDEVVFFYTDDYMEQFSQPPATKSKTKKSYHSIRTETFIKRNNAAAEADTAVGNTSGSTGNAEKPKVDAIIGIDKASVRTVNLSTEIGADGKTPDAARTASDAAEVVLMNTKEPSFGTVGGEWAVAGLARSTERVPDGYFEKYYSDLVQKLGDTGGVLSKTKYTEYSRTIIALTAIGKNAASVGGYALTQPLCDFEATVKQGLNGAVFALIALDCGNYKAVDNQNNDVRGLYIKYILERQNADGGWSLDAAQNASDADITAMALTALSKYTARPDVSTACDKALECLSLLCKNGRSIDSSESISQMITALCELGVSPRSERFFINGKEPSAALLEYYIPAKGFLHVKSDRAVNAMSTEQGLCALAALSRYDKGKNSFYSMSDAAGYTFPAKNPDVKDAHLTSAGKTFADIKEHKCRSAAEALAACGILNGKTSDTFDPDGRIKRSEYAAAVVRGLSLPEKTTDKFTDVKISDWFFGYVGTAYSYGIVKGVSAGTFNPDGEITREEAAVMTARAASLCGIDTESQTAAGYAVLSGFSDGNAVSEWARASVAFCLRYGIYGCDGDKLLPAKAITRAETSEMLYGMLVRAGLLSGESE